MWCQACAHCKVRVLGEWWWALPRATIERAMLADAVEQENERAALVVAVVPATNGVNGRHL